MCFKLPQLSYYVLSCYGIALHENNYDTSHKQKRFHTISQNTYQIISVILIELAKSVDCDFSCTKLALQKIRSVVNTNFAKRLAPYFSKWCASPPLTCCIKNFMFHCIYKYCCCACAQGAFYIFWLSHTLMKIGLFYQSGYFQLVLRMTDIDLWRLTLRIRLPGIVFVWNSLETVRNLCR